MGIFYIPKKKKEVKTYRHCRMCKAKIMWTVTKARKNMPIDYNPKLDYLFDDIAKVHYIKELMTSHWGTCTFANEFHK